MPVNSSGLNECRLLRRVALAEAHRKYSALSYCAGDPKQFLLNGRKFNVFANLGRAIMEARQFWIKMFGTRECVLWVDQICIDQSNLLERSHQVGFMRDIYARAEQVLLCLSTGEHDGYGIEWLQELYDAVPPLDDDLDKEAARHSANGYSDDPDFRQYHLHRLNDYM